ncbi:MAG: efflux RND transporter permease subunit [Myxococcota bacterium]
MNITEVSIRRPVLAWMIMAATVLFGLVAARRIGISQFPDVDFPTISVQVTWEGAAPEAVETDVVEPIEEALVQVEGVKSLSSSSQQGSASITLELNLDRNVDFALQDVQARIAQTQRLLPKDIDPPIVSKTNPEDQPIMWIAISGPYARQMLSDIARYRVKEELQTIPGVGEIVLGGYLDRNVRIWIDASRLDAKNVTVNDVIAALRREHVELPAGRMETAAREVSVRIMGEALDLETLRAIVVAEPIGGSPIYLSDVALVEDGFEDVRRIGRVGGSTAQGMGIKKQRGSNAVAVARAVKAKMAQIQASLPENMELGVNMDATQFIEESVAEIELEILLAVALTALVCWLFLGSLSSTLNVILAIPMSLLGTVGVVYFAGFTLNTFTLLALGLAVGIVVDDAIMVMENVFRHSEHGKERATAALEGTKEITFAALSATLAVVAIFLPVIFMEGVIGKFFLQFGVTLSLAVLLSYVEAITLAPARLAQLVSAHEAGRKGIGKLVDRAFHALSVAYGRILAVFLKAPGLVLLVGLVVLGASIWGFQKLPQEFVPSQDQSRLMIRMQTAAGSSLDETDQLFKKVELVVAERPEINRTFGVVGGFGGAGVNSAVLFVTLVPPHERKATQADIAAFLRKEINAIPGLRGVVMDLSQSGFTAQRGFPVELSVRGADFDQLVKSSDELRRELNETGLVTDVDTDYQLGVPELRIVPDRARAADIGVPIEDVASTLNALVGGVRVGKYSTGGRRLDVRLRLLAGQRSRPDDIARLKVRTKGGALVPLSTLVSTEERPALQQIIRKDRERAISIFANVAAGHSQDEALAKVEELGKKLPAGYRVVLGGASVAFKESSNSLFFALAMGLIAAYMILAAQFNSFLHPVTVLTILPLSVAGAELALWISGGTLNIFSMIGLLLLLGIVKKNSILLVDYANEMKAKGASAKDAMLAAGPVRLRPILMTTTATLMAAVPSALSLGPGAEVRAPMAVGIIGGLFVSTPMSLLVVPAFYVLADRAVQALKLKKAPQANLERIS